METLYIVLGIIIVLLILYVFIIFNKLVKLKNDVNEAFSTMDVCLKKRWDLIPNLVTTVKGYAKHESDTLENVIKARYNDLSNNEKITENENISDSLTKIMAVAENYPDLKADKNFLDLQKNLTALEDEIAKSRKYYNAVVRSYNNIIGMFPSNIVSFIFGHKKLKMYEIKESEKENIKVSI